MQSYAIMQQIHRKTCRGIDVLPALRRDVHIDDTAEAVLRRENCCDTDAGRDQTIKIALTASVYTGLIGDESDPAIPY
jgi:hypothetical protein